MLALLQIGSDRIGSRTFSLVRTVLHIHNDTPSIDDGFLNSTFLPMGFSGAYIQPAFASYEYTLSLSIQWSSPG